MGACAHETINTPGHDRREEYQFVGHIKYWFFARGYE